MPKQPPIIEELRRVQAHYGYTNAEMVAKINDALPRPILTSEQAYCRLKNTTSGNRYEHRQNAVLNSVEAALKVIDRRHRWFCALEAELDAPPTDDDCYQAFLVMAGYSTYMPESQAYPKFCEALGVRDFAITLITFKRLASLFEDIFKQKTRPYHE